MGNNETTPLRPDSLLGGFAKPNESWINETIMPLVENENKPVNVGQTKQCVPPKMFWVLFQTQHIKIVSDLHQIALYYGMILGQNCTMLYGPVSIQKEEC